MILFLTTPRPSQRIGKEDKMHCLVSIWEFVKVSRFIFKSFILFIYLYLNTSAYIMLSNI